MKKNKIKILGLSVVLLVAMAGCRPANTNMRNMSTQTRLYNDNLNNRWMTNTPYNTRDRLNTNLNNGMVRDNTNLNNGMIRDRTNLDSGMITNERISTNVSNLSTKADAIAKKVAALPEVNSASVVIHGNTAIVGCDVKGTAGTTGTTGTTTNTINPTLRKKVEAAVRTADKNIKNISVTSDPTLYTRIRTMSTNINNGHPISNFTRDIEDLLRSITTPVRTTPVRTTPVR